MDINFPTEDAESPFTRRDGHPTHHEEPASELIDLHQIIEFITPNELFHLVCSCVFQLPKLSHEANQASLLIPCEFGSISITSSAGNLPWNAESPTDELTMVIDFQDLFISPQRLNELNLRYARFQLVNYGDNLRARSQHTLRGGRTAENLLWTLIQHFQDGERLHKDLTIFMQKSSKDI